MAHSLTALFYLLAGAAGCSALIMGWLRSINFRTNRAMGVVRESQGSTQEVALTILRSL